jgi:hypothetical protein
MANSPEEIKQALENYGVTATGQDPMKYLLRPSVAAVRTQRTRRLLF